MRRTSAHRQGTGEGRCVSPRRQMDSKPPLPPGAALIDDARGRARRGSTLQRAGAKNVGVCLNCGGLKWRAGFWWRAQCWMGGDGWWFPHSCGLKSVSAVPNAPGMQSKGSARGSPEVSTCSSTPLTPTRRAVTSVGPELISCRRPATCTMPSKPSREKAPSGKSCE